MSDELLHPREGKSLDLVFAPIRLWGSFTSSLSAKTASKAIVVDGLMRNATVKANGDDIVTALNRVHALGWATSRSHLKLGAALAELLFETYDVTRNAADIGATLICDRIKLSPSISLCEDPDCFLLIVREYQLWPLGFTRDLYSGVLLDK